MNKERTQDTAKSRGKRQDATAQDIERKLEAYFASVPTPATATVDEAVNRIVKKAAQRPTSHATSHATQNSALIVPSILSLVSSQLRASRGLVWIAQAIVVLLALIVAASTNERAFMLGALGAASAILAGITVAGISFDQGSPFVEVSYSFHFDYRQVMIARMMLYGLGDLIGLTLLTLLGASLAQLGLSDVAPNFGDVVLCSSVTFFSTGFVCFLLISRYRGEAATVLCFAFSALIAITSDVLWSNYPSLLYKMPGVFWAALIIAGLVGLLLCARSMFTKINAGYDFIRTKMN
jgi:hypothetical protein